MYASSLALLLACPVLAGATTFDEFVTTYGRGYPRGSPEYAQRRALFEARLARIEAHNLRPGRLWTAAVNHLADQTEEELSQLRGWRHVDASAPSAYSVLQTGVEAQPAREIEWSKGLTSLQEVRNQRACGSCWAVASAVMLESRFEAQTKKTRSFSEQELVDCVPNPKECGGQGGCSGATVELAMEYVKAHGLKTGREMPYSGVAERCKSSGKPSGKDASLAQVRREGSERVGLVAWRTLERNKATPMMLALADGPVAIAAAAGPWQAYSSGVFDGCDKDAVIDHAVVVTGYGRDAELKQNYWNIRNSWGPNWGENGNIRMLRHDKPGQDDQYCGTDHDPAKGIECKPYRKAVTVCGMCGMLYDAVAIDFGREPRDGGTMPQLSPGSSFLARAA